MPVHTTTRRDAVPARRSCHELRPILGPFALTSCPRCETFLGINNGQTYRTRVGVGTARMQSNVRAHPVAGRVAEGATTARCLLLHSCTAPSPTLRCWLGGNVGTRPSSTVAPRSTRA